MSEEKMYEIVSSLERLNAPPEEVRFIIIQLWEKLDSQRTEPDDKLAEESKDLFLRLHDLPVIMGGKKQKTFGQVLSDLKEATPEGFLSDLTPDNFYQTFPFDRLGKLPVASTDDEAAKINVTRIRDLFHVLKSHSVTLQPVPGLDDNRKANSFTIEQEHDWWTFLVYSEYSASTRVYAKGWDAADHAGTFYEASKNLCILLKKVIDQLEKGDAQTQSLEPIRDWYCNIAKSAPKVPYPCYWIKTTVCNCFARSAVGWDFEDHNDCTSNKVYWTPGPVEASHENWGGPVCPGVASKHEVQFSKTSIKYTNCFY